ncbi:MAG TPA: sigma-70 family RNA polymerase sigma factor [Acidimicrobiales bacterium]|nr:sigma-70 family RNA polymerase sigma factor [Acidimicrobiales bacterium]
MGGGPNTEDARAFEGFYANHCQAVTSYVRRRAGDAEFGDIVAQVFCVAWRRFDIVPSPPEDRLWLYGVARRIVADHRRSVLRRTKLRQRLAGELAHTTDLPASFELLQSQVAAAMKRLSAREHEVLRLVVWEELSHAEAAARLGCSPNAVEIRYRRARVRFRAAFLAYTGAGSKEALAVTPAITVRPAAGEQPHGGHMPRALITGITGQDGRYLAELLIGKGYQVHGMVRGQANPKAKLVQDEVPEVELIDGDLTDLSSLIAVVEQVQPDEVYNLGAISFVKLSFSQPELTANVSGSGVLRMLEAIRIVGGHDNRIRFYQAATSEMFGEVHEVPQTETTPFHPRSPYGTAKVFGYYTTLNYRESYAIHASNGILFNHTSPRRGLEFVERKISNAVARISLGLQGTLTLGNLETSRDFGYAGDYVEAMWRMLQQDEPGDFVVATGRTWSVREVLDLAFRAVGIEDWAPYVATDGRFRRPAEVDHLVGDASKARAVLGWEPKVEFPQVLEEMVRNDIELERAKANLE